MTVLDQSGTPATRRRRGYAFRAGAALGLSAVLALTACGGSEAGGKTEGLQKVTFLTNVPTAGLTWAAELVAQTCGHFAKEGLDVEFQYINGAPAGVQAILAGTGLLVRPGDTDTMQSIVTGAPIVNVGAVQKGGSTLRVVSHRDRPLDTAASMNGKTMGVGSTGGSTKVTLDLVLASAGLKPEALKRQVVGLTPAVFNLVETRKLDGYVVSLDTAFTLQGQQPDAVVFDPSTVTSAGSNNYVTSSANAKDPVKSDQIRRFMRGVAASMKAIIADKANGYAETKKCISSKYDVASLKDQKVTQQAMDVYVDSWQTGGADKLLQTDPAAWQKTYDELVKAGLVEAGKDPSQWFSNEFAPTGAS
ncbi:ABC transporter substrate-binding protein [Plantactinospora solaniradicis]|uniref:ABC transporter substrate-binding protein n=1 Tax=Plantactinospora solaniradicis TaxID=1723736 RepID=A0ABW1KHN3_9ACTN